MILRRATEWLWSHVPIIEKVVNSALAPVGPPALSGSLDEDTRLIQERAQVRTDISDHLLTIYAEAVEVHPRLVVELGTRGGESTYALIAAARRAGGTVVSIDIEDCERSATGENWIFVRGDDVALAATFGDLTRSKGLPDAIDVLFIDTSHHYGHTTRELAAWAPFVKQGAKIILHDTNMGEWTRRRDGSVDISWNNDRGVIRAVEEYLGIRVNEHRAIVALAGGWLLRHHPECNGLTVLRRLSEQTTDRES